MLQFEATHSNNYPWLLDASMSVQVAKEGTVEIKFGMQVAGECACDITARPLRAGREKSVQGTGGETVGATEYGPLFSTVLAFEKTGLPLLRHPERKAKELCEGCGKRKYAV